MKTLETKGLGLVSAIIGIAGYVLMFVWFGWKLALIMFLFHWSINLYLAKEIKENENT